ncbi:putative rhamnogalacturonase [Tothia fuscella]|uniref:rhamnogalacturonan endolyase n=1 Tax=Tothia fuscella TaxID=1048955 RepID=A0A9P4NPJ3_9PEZI|nr:putative rhamnogalacturonase [Tothia fuscella]
MFHGIAAFMLLIAGIVLCSLPPVPLKAAGEPFLKLVDDKTFVIGNDFWNLTTGESFGTKLWYKGYDLVGNASGHYVSYNGAANNLSWTLTPPKIHRKSGIYTDIVFSAKEGDVHFVLTPTLTGAYQYFVNRALPKLGEFRTLWRLDNATFTHGFTNSNDLPLPPLSDFRASTTIQDETWQRKDGTFITKYDLSTFMPSVEGDLAFWGIYGKLPNGEGVGSWYIHGGKDYLNGDHLKQELMVHRESITGDAVLLNMIHGTHFQASSGDDFAEGKVWGPWLWLLNDGSPTDAAAKAKSENADWPYKWHIDQSGYDMRSFLSGRVVLSDGRPAAGAAIFLGDRDSKLSTLDQGKGYYYRTYATPDGKFTLENVREGNYTLSAWPNGGPIGDVTTVATKDVNVSLFDYDIGDVKWETQNRKKIWQIGSIDRKATGFQYAGPPHEHARAEKCPKNLTFTIGTNTEKDWCFSQWSRGIWSIFFTLPPTTFVNNTSSNAAVLSISLAGYSSGIQSTVRVNGVLTVPAFGGASVKGDPGLYRSATTAGEWRLFEFLVAGGGRTGSVLREGENRIDFVVVGEPKKWSGFMWDSVLLEWA